MEDRVKVAIPMFNSRVSPSFDFASNVLVATVENGKILDKEKYSLINLNPIRRSALLKDQGVNVLICGGVSNFTGRLLMSNGIEVIPMVSGEAEEVLNHFVKGNLDVKIAPITPAKETGRYRGGRGGYRRRGSVFKKR